MVSPHRTIRVWLKRDSGQYWPSVYHTMSCKCSSFFFHIFPHFVLNDRSAQCVCNFQSAKNSTTSTSVVHSCFCSLFLHACAHSVWVSLVTMTLLMNHTDSASQNDMRVWSLNVLENRLIGSSALLTSVLQCCTSLTVCPCFPSLVQLKEIPCYHQQDLKVSISEPETAVY